MHGTFEDVKRAPVAVFVYNRISDAKEVLEALNENYLASESDLFIFSDASKSYQDEQKVQEVRSYILKYQTYTKFKSVKIKMAENNQGLAKSIIEGVTQIINNYGMIIVLEDDCVPTKDFLKYMNEALCFFRGNDAIWSIAGYGYSLPSLSRYPYDTYLSYRGSSWGWATWKEMWEMVDWDVVDYKKFKYSIIRRRRFCRGGNDLPTMLKAQVNGKIDSWAVRWCYSQSKWDKLTVYPKISRVYNRGFYSGTHGTRKDPDKICNMESDGAHRECCFENSKLDSTLVREMQELFRLKLKDRIMGFIEMQIKYFRKKKSTKVLIWGITYQADLAFHILEKDYEIIGFYDDDHEKQGKLYQDMAVFSTREMMQRKNEYEVMIADIESRAEIKRKCKQMGIKVLGVYKKRKYTQFELKDLLKRRIPQFLMHVTRKINRKARQEISFDELLKQKSIHLYAGDVPDNDLYEGKIGLSITQADSRHILHNILEPYPLPDDSVDSYMAEDVLEHLPYDKLGDVIDEIYRILKPGGLFRLALPDYRNDIMRKRSLKDKKGNILFDPLGGGIYKDAKVLEGGHLWFPQYEAVKKLVEKSKFNKYEFLHYYDESGKSITKPIDYSKGYISRTPDHAERVKIPYRALSIVVDMYK